MYLNFYNFIIIQSRRVARIFRGGWGGGGGGKGVRLSSEGTYKLVGGSGGMRPQEILEFLDCLALHFARFHDGEREYRVV